MRFELIEGASYKVIALLCPRTCFLRLRFAGIGNALAANLRLSFLLSTQISSLMLKWLPRRYVVHTKCIPTFYCPSCSCYSLWKALQRPIFDNTTTSTLLIVSLMLHEACTRSPYSRCCREMIKPNSLGSMDMPTARFDGNSVSASSGLVGKCMQMLGLKCQPVF